MEKKLEVLHRLDGGITINGIAFDKTQTQAMSMFVNDVVKRTIDELATKIMDKIADIAKELTEDK